jgi:DnaK suppressor protein
VSTQDPFYEHDEFTTQEMMQIRDGIVNMMQELAIVVQSSAADTVELDQARVGRLARMDEMQHQQIAKSQLAAAKEKLIGYGNVLNRFDEAPEEFGYCFYCEEIIPFKRLCIRPESRICVPCLEEN